MKTTAQPLAPAGEDNKPGDVMRNIVSLLIFIHLFCVTVALWGNFQRSAVEGRLLAVLAPYLRTLHLDPDGARFHLVHSSQTDDDRFFEVEILGDTEAAEDQETAPKGKIVQPEMGWRGGLARHRYFALGHIVGFYANPDTENETVTGELAKAIGGAVLREQGATRGVIRCRQQMSQPRELSRLVAGFPRDPLAPQYAVTEYEADVWFDDQGQVQINPRIAALETAAVEEGTKSEEAKKEEPEAKQKPIFPLPGTRLPESPPIRNESSESGGADAP